MNGYYKGLILCCLFLGFLLLFRRIRWLEVAGRLLKQTREGMEESARQRVLRNRRNLLLMRQEHSVLLVVEQELQYSGWKRHLPFLTAESFLAINMVFVSAMITLLLFLSGNILLAITGGALFLGLEYALLQGSKLRSLRKVNDNLMKLLDFLGNYSITAGEVTGILYQISKYIEEPLSSVLMECSFEAQTTGDTSLALLSMAEKLEHPKFKELVQNLEISVRYSADFTSLVRSSRRSLREYLRQREERKGMLLEAVINLLMLLAMSMAVFLIVDQMIELSLWEILLYSIPGRIAMTVLVGILILFMRQIVTISK